MAYAPNRAPAVSDSVVIMTRAELKAREDAAFKRGVERGRFEESSELSRSESNRDKTGEQPQGAAGRGCE